MTNWISVNLRVVKFIGMVELYDDMSTPNVFSFCRIMKYIIYDCLIAAKLCGHNIFVFSRYLEDEEYLDPHR